MALYLQGKTIQVTLDSSSETVGAQREWHIFQVLKENNCQRRILYLVKISFRNLL